VLVIDDNSAIHDDFLKILGGTVRPEGMSDLEASLFDDPVNQSDKECFQVDSVFQGQEGLESVRRALAEHQPYALAFVDIRMPPGWDGVETTARIWEVDPDIQIVICTAYSDYSWDNLTAKLGQLDRLVILKKPFDNIEVLQLSRALSRKWQLSQQIRQKLNDLEQIVQKRTAELTISNQSLKVEIEERKHAEQERQALENQLHQAQKLEAVGQLAAGIAHEINTPMQFVGDNTRFINDGFKTLLKVLLSYEDLMASPEIQKISPERLQQVREIVVASDLDYLRTQIPAAIEETLEGVDRVTKIVRAMKEFSHPSGLVKAAADLNRAIESTVTVTRNEWKYVAEMKLELDSSLPPVCCFVGEINQCILNLIVNAAHAIQDVVKTKPSTKGLITIQTRLKNNDTEIRVSDTGTGIPESARPHIFEQFFTTKPVGKGTGQGLAMVYGIIVKKHAGTVHFETERDKGTTFILRLPIVPRN